MMEEFIQEFKAEAASIIETLQGLLLTYEESTSKQQIAEELFRGIHTLKGTSKMFGFDNIEQVTHKLEDILDQFRSTGLPFPEAFIATLDATLAYANDVLEGRTDNSILEKLLSEIETYQDVSVQSPKGDERLYCVVFKPQHDIFERGINPVSILKELYGLGQLVFESVPLSAIEEQAAKRTVRKVTYDIWIAATCVVADVEDVFLFLKSTEYTVHEIQYAEAAREICEKLEAKGRKNEDVANTERRRDAISAWFDTRTEACKTETVSPEAQDTITNELPVTQGEQKKLNYVNVALPKLDLMMTLVSEFVTLAGKVKFHAARAGIDELVDVSERLEKASTQFRDNAFSMRLVPIQILSTKLQRYAKDLGRQLGKKVRFIAEGMETELDKSIINQIEAPLMHIIRNALDHGLETPDVRVAAGKSEEGLLKLSAFYSGTNVFIHIQDDGSGIDLDRVRKKAIEKRLVDHHDILNADELVKLIFRPGFSTTDHATEVSGRGVGMDVVQKQINELRGSVDVTTEKGLGTSFAIRLPLALSIMDALIVQSGEWKYLLPHSDVEHCSTERFGNLIERKGSNLRYKDKLIPFLSLAELQPSRQKIQQEPSIVILNKADQLIAIEVDEILGKDQVVIKPIDDVFGTASFLSGTTILGDGDLAFLIDGVKLKEQYVR